MWCSNFVHVHKCKFLLFDITTDRNTQTTANTPLYFKRITFSYVGQPWQNFSFLIISSADASMSYLRVDRKWFSLKNKTKPTALWQWAIFKIKVKTRKLKVLIKFQINALFQNMVKSIPVSFQKSTLCFTLFGSTEVL